MKVIVIDEMEEEEVSDQIILGLFCLYTSGGERRKEEKARMNLLFYGQKWHTKI